MTHPGKGMALIAATLAAALTVGVGTAQAGWRSMNVQMAQHILACKDATKVEFVDHPLAPGEAPLPDVVHSTTIGVYANPGSSTLPLSKVEDPNAEPVVVKTVDVPFDLTVVDNQPFNNHGVYTLQYNAPLPVGSALRYAFFYPDLNDFYIDITDLGDGLQTPILVQDCTLLAPDTSPPTCQIAATGRYADGRQYLVFEVRDTGSGLARTATTYLSNAKVEPFSFTPGTTDPVRITVSAIRPKAFGVQIDLFDTAGNTSFCDPVLTTVTSDGGRPNVQSFTDLPQEEHHVAVTNGRPGIRHMTVIVNGRVFGVNGLKDGEARKLDVASAMRPGRSNHITLAPVGPRGGSATVLISN
ncbi:MAG TPA: hypothetical protein VFM58_19450 [Solirubrobacteraceae bacterium]|nr:hypothetical protein [Solirubrobacteraceae bacterium]